MAVGEGSDTDVASLSRAITAGRPPAPLLLPAGSKSPRASALRLLVLVVLLVEVGEAMVALGCSAPGARPIKNEAMHGNVNRPNAPK